MSRSLAHPLAFVVPLTLAFALACGGSSTTAPPPPPAPTAPATPTTPTEPNAPVAPVPAAPAVPPPAKTFDQAAFTCCDAERADSLLDQYLDVEARLFKGDADHINGQYTALKGVAQGAIDKGGFSADDNVILKRIVQNSDASLQADLAGKRKLFREISTDTIAFLKNHRSSGTTKVAQAHCPMFEGGSDWLQKEPTLANPYYGDAMATCGSFL